MISAVDYQPPDREIYIGYGYGYIVVGGCFCWLWIRKFVSEGKKHIGGFYTGNGVGGGVLTKIICWHTAEGKYRGGMYGRWAIWLRIRQWCFFQGVMSPNYKIIFPGTTLGHISKLRIRTRMLTYMVKAAAALRVVLPRALTAVVVYDGEKVRSVEDGTNGLKEFTVTVEL